MSSNRGLQGRRDGRRDEGIVSIQLPTAKRDVRPAERGKGRACLCAGRVVPDIVDGSLSFGVRALGVVCFPGGYRPVFERRLHNTSSRILFGHLTVPTS